MNTDNQLLAEYANQGAEPAFRELVSRHINMVHSAALRESNGDHPLAEDITQEVFTELARRARKLSSHPALAGWLYTCVRQMTANVRRSESRRRRREEEAFSMNEPTDSHEMDQLWQQVRPVLDDAMHELNQQDRSAVVLRFFEGLSLKEVGTALGLSENAARMRVDRSLEKLHGLLSRRGIKSTTATLAVALAARGVFSTPSSFAANIATGALSTAGKSSFALTKLVTAAKSKTAIAAAVGVLAAGAFLWHHFSQSANSGAGSTHAPAAVSTPTVANDNSQSQPMAPGTTNAATAASPPQMLFHLVDADTGEPLSGAKLHLFYLLQDGRGKVVHSTTDSKGQAEIDMPQPPYFALNFFVTAADHVPMVTSWILERRSMPSDYTMKIKRGVSIGGTVVDESGNPIAGAKVEFDSGGNNISLAENVQFTGDAAVKTDANGKWTSDMIPPDSEGISLIVTEGKHAETHTTVHPASPDAKNLTITMPAGFPVKGTVENSKGDPIPGAQVRQVRLNDEGEQVKTTDSSGAFNFPAMAAGELTLAVTADGFAPGVQTIDVTNSTVPLKFQLGPGEILRGRIVDEQGNPVANAFIETTRRSMDKIKWSTNTDADGRFQWNSAPEEPLLYSVLAEGFDRVYSHSLTADGSEQVIQLTRENPDKDTIKIAGTVTDIDSGEPLSNFKVFVKDADADFTFPPQFYTDGQNGKFAISLPSKTSHPGYVVQIEQGGYLPAESDHLQRTNGNQALVFNLHKGSGPSGIVLLPGGEPAVNSAVLLCTPQAGVVLDSAARVQKQVNTTTYTTQTDNDGRFSLSPAIDPQGVMIVHPRGFAELSMSQIPSNGIITLQPWGAVKGTLSIDSQPAPNQTVSIFNQEVHYSSEGRAMPFLTFNSSATTDTNGGFVFDKVPPGEWHVFMLQSQFRVNAYETTVTVKPGSVTEVALGAAGRTLIGKASQPPGTDAPDWQNVTARLLSKTDGTLDTWPQRTNFATVDAFIAAQKAYRQAQANEKNFGANLQSDGSFSLRGIPPGTYELKIETRDSKRNSAVPHDLTDPSPVVASVVKDVTIPDDSSTDPIDLGTLELVPQSGNISTR